MTYTISRWSYGDSIPSSGILLIRHGPREGGNNPLHDAELTQEGRGKCLEFGNNWTGPPPSILLVSTVPRCVETGTLIRMGACWEIELDGRTILGNPGPFVKDEKAFQNFVNLEKDLGFLLRHIDGQEIPGMRNRDMGCELLVKELKGKVMDNDLLLAISHDSIIAALLAYGGQNPNPWPEPLCGAMVDFHTSKPNPSVFS